MDSGSYTHTYIDKKIYIYKREHVQEALLSGSIEVCTFNKRSKFNQYLLSFCIVSDDLRVLQCLQLSLKEGRGNETKP